MSDVEHVDGTTPLSIGRTTNTNRNHFPRSFRAHRQQWKLSRERPIRTESTYEVRNIENVFSNVAEVLRVAISITSISVIRKRIISHHVSRRTSGIVRLHGERSQLVLIWSDSFGIRQFCFLFLQKFNPPFDIT